VTEDIKMPPHWPVAKDKVRYMGDAVAVVVATSRQLATDAAEAAQVDYEPLPAVTDVEGALAEGAPLVHEDLGTNKSFKWSPGGCTGRSNGSRSGRGTTLPPSTAAGSCRTWSLRRPRTASCSASGPSSSPTWGRTSSSSPPASPCWAPGSTADATGRTPTGSSTRASLPTRPPP